MLSSAVNPKNLTRFGGVDRILYPVFFCATDDREPTRLHSEPDHGREEKGATAESRETETERSVSHRVSPRVQPGSTHRPKERSRAT